MDKNKKHEKAEAFRTAIISGAVRKQHLTDLVSKTTWDESDKLRVVILLQKATYLSGCEEEYKTLLQKISQSGDASLANKATGIAKKLNMTKHSLLCHIV